MTSIYNRHTATRPLQLSFKFGLFSFKLLVFKQEKVAVSDARPFEASRKSGDPQCTSLSDLSKIRQRLAEFIRGKGGFVLPFSQRGGRSNEIKFGQHIARPIVSAP